MEKTTYEKLGAENLHLLVGRFYEGVLANPVIAPLFKTDISEVKRKQELFLTQFLGGPALYTAEFGHPKLRFRHLPHPIDEQAVIEWLRCMKVAIDGLPIEEALKDEVFVRFPRAAMHMANK